MDNNTLKNRVFGQTTDAVRDDSGYWNITCTIFERVVYPNGEERKEEIYASAMDTEFHLAHELALSSVLFELQKLVYSRGFDSLIEGMDYQRNLEANHVVDRQADEDTTTQ